MEQYKNLSGKSSVTAFAIGIESMDVEFNGASLYRYTSGSTGFGNLATMKRLAVVGQGLGSFISTTVRKNYAAKLR